MAKVDFSFDGDCLRAQLTGEIDQHTAGALRREIDGQLGERQPRALELDMQGVSFMDSSGIGLILGRYKKMGELGGGLSLSHVPPDCEKIIGMSGITNILDIKEN